MASNAKTMQPAFNNRQATYKTIRKSGETLIVYRQPGEKPYPKEVRRALQVVKQNPCKHLPIIYEIEPNRIIAEYLNSYVPLAKAGITSAQYNLFGDTPRRFKRWRIRRDQEDMSVHFESFLDQLRQLGSYLREHSLWHSDVIPQNVMWNRHTHHLKLVDICAMCPIDSVMKAEQPYYGHGRTEGVYRKDYSLNQEYVSDVFLQDLAPWPIVMLRKMGIGIKK